VKLEEELVLMVDVAEVDFTDEDEELALDDDAVDDELLFDEEVIAEEELLFDEETATDEDVLFDEDTAVEEELLWIDEVIETRDVVVKINEDDEVDALSTLVVIPSKASANTTVPSVSAVVPTTVSPPVRSKLVTSNNAPAPM
jgi:hypothetical protein